MTIDHKYWFCHGLSSSIINEAVVFALAALLVIELRGTVHVGYWLQLKPVHTALFILGQFAIKKIQNYIKSRGMEIVTKQEAESRGMHRLDASSFVAWPILNDQSCRNVQLRTHKVQGCCYDVSFHDNHVCVENSEKPLPYML